MEETSSQWSDIEYTGLKFKAQTIQTMSDVPKTSCKQVCWTGLMLKWVKRIKGKDKSYNDKKTKEQRKTN